MRERARTDGGGDEDALGVEGADAADAAGVEAEVEGGALAAVPALPAPRLSAPPLHVHRALEPVPRVHHHRDRVRPALDLRVALKLFKFSPSARSHPLHLPDYLNSIVDWHREGALQQTQHSQHQQASHHRRKLLPRGQMQ